MEDLFYLLNFISCIAAFIFLISCIIFISELPRGIRHKLGFKEAIKSAISPINEFWGSLLPKTAVVIIYILILLGTIHIAIFSFCKNEIIGSLYEKPSHETQYQCTLRSDGYENYSSLMYEGIATVFKSDGKYTITEIQLGQNLKVYYDTEYNPKSMQNEVETNEWNIWDISISDKPCSEEYAKSIRTRRFSTSNICASKNSDVYHNKRCGYVKNISSENLISFPDTAVADLMKSRSCERCGRWATTK